MATDKPRITITLEPDHYAILRRMANAQGGSMARIVTELVSEMAPLLGRVADMLEATVKAQQNMKVSMRKAADQAEEDMKPLMQVALSQFDFFASEMERIASAADQPTPEVPQSPTAPGVAGTVRRSSTKAKGPRTVITGATNPNGGCLCTITEHERQENKLCPVHFPPKRRRA